MATSNGFALLVLNRIGWRLYSVIMSLPAIIAVIILIFLPESPKFLNRGRKDDSTKLKKALKLVQLQVKFKYPIIQCIMIHCRVILHLQS